MNPPAVSDPPGDAIPVVMARRIFAATVVVLAVFNLARSAGLFGGAADTVGVVLAIVLTAVALRCGLDRTALGLRVADLPAGARDGLVAFGLVVVVIGAAALIPFTSGFLDDSRADVDAFGVMSKVAVGILLGVVIPEELVFRGVLLGAGRAAWGTRVGVLASSAVFGLWHIMPTIGNLGSNAGLGEVDSSSVGRMAVVAGTVLATFTAGLVFSALRLHSRSLLAPVLAHLATNAVAFVVAWLVST